MKHDEFQCPRIHLRQVYGFDEPYCISKSREKPVPVNVEEKGRMNEYCKSSDFKKCPMYRRRSIVPSKDVGTGLS